MSELIPIERIEAKILLIREQKVMLDRDMAKLYEVETRVLNQAISRRFYVPINERRDGELDVINCDIQSGENGVKKKTLCFYRARCSNAFVCAQ